MQPAVEVMLTGVLGRFTSRATLETRVIRGFKSSEKPASQAEASPQQAESLATAGDGLVISKLIASQLVFVYNGFSNERERLNMTISPNDGQDWHTDGVQEYHTYFGTPTHDDHVLFELLTVGVFQVGLSWQAAASKLPVYRRVFAGMAIPKVAAMIDELAIPEIAADTEMIGNQRKIRAVLLNARAILKVQAEFGSFSAYLWAFVDGTPYLLPAVTRDELTNQSAIGSAVTKDLKRRGFSFVGPVVTHMFLLAAGILREQIIGD